jgi:Ran GTPase-activating protein (RanGAP) involved in mRNA processing and transport
MAEPIPTNLTTALTQLIDRVDRYMRHEPRHTIVNVVGSYTSWLACRVKALEELSNAGFDSQVTELVYNWGQALQARGGDLTTTLLSWNRMYGKAVADNTPERLAHAERMRKVKLEMYGAFKKLGEELDLGSPVKKGMVRKKEEEQSEEDEEEEGKEDEDEDEDEVEETEVDEEDEELGTADKENRGICH